MSLNAYSFKYILSDGIAICHKFTKRKQLKNSN